MTKQTVKLRLEKSGTEQVLNAVVGIASIAIMYYSLHPSVAEEHLDRVRGFCQKILHRISVAEAITAIRSLPETPERM